MSITRKEDDFGEWYSEVVVIGEMIEYYDIPGCYVMRPWAVSIWEIMKEFFDAEIKKMKIKNCYFPLFIPAAGDLKKEENDMKGAGDLKKEENDMKGAGDLKKEENDMKGAGDLKKEKNHMKGAGDLKKEKNHHMKGFAPQTAWVTHYGESVLNSPIAIRPTSETIMCPYFSKWIRGHRDLPLRLNQWCNVVRWEPSKATPFIRSCEFLWQEGHTAFATKEEADAEVLDILELYRCIYEELLAVPVIKGKKSEHGTFPGGLYTTTVEAFVPNTGRGVQGATSNCLGQNFARMFDINFVNEKGENGMVWQNSWAFTTRTLGVMVMVHGDDRGLVLPPKVASLQAIVIPIVPNQDDAVTDDLIFDACATTVKSLNEAGIRADADLRDSYSYVWKRSHWETKGVPLRIEIGPEDLANKQVRAVRRDSLAETDIPMANLAGKVKEMLDFIQQNLFDVAKQKRDSCTQVVHTWEEFVEALGHKKLIFAPWCDEKAVEKDVIARTKGAAKTLCSPLDQPPLADGTLCFASGKPAKQWAYWGMSY